MEQSKTTYHLLADKRKNEKLQFLFWLQTYTGEQYSTKSPEFLLYWSIYQKGKLEGKAETYKEK